ncbi:YheC/YheD family protein [Paenibacillaceae bacterium]|nr:YheC/YheD family protein [Paenibacillaceae bacterium]
MKKKRWTLGIMIGLRQAQIEQLLASGSGQQLEAKVPEDAFCRSLCSAGEKYELDVYLFSPLMYDSAKQQLLGIRLMNDRWECAVCPLPDLVYDRCFYCSKEERARVRDFLHKMTCRHRFMKLGSDLPGKREVFYILAQSAELAGLLPQTFRYRDPVSLAQQLAAHPHGLFLKPDAGSQGRGAMHLYQGNTGKTLHLRGRDLSNRPLAAAFPNAEAALQAVAKFIGRRRYIVQPYLALTDHQGRAFDLRVLVQKNERGNWSVTGMSVRTGENGSVTSNVHGGGTATDAEAALKLMLSTEKAAMLMKRIRFISMLVPHQLEKACGRLFELGLDFGIDTEGRLWLLEANSKPGRTVFDASPGNTGKKAVERPLQYARLLGAGVLKVNRLISDSAQNSVDTMKKRFPKESFQEVHP